MYLGKAREMERDQEKLSSSKYLHAWPALTTLFNTALLLDFP